MPEALMQLVVHGQDVVVRLAGPTGHMLGSETGG